MAPFIALGVFAYVMGFILTVFLQLDKTNEINWSIVLGWPFWAILEVIKHTWHAFKEYVENFND
jgi:hypothetical protein